MNEACLRGRSAISRRKLSEGREGSIDDVYSARLEVRKIEQRVNLLTAHLTTNNEMWTIQHLYPDTRACPSNCRGNGTHFEGWETKKTHWESTCR